MQDIFMQDCNIDHDGPGPHAQLPAAALCTPWVDIMCQGSMFFMNNESTQSEQGEHRKRKEFFSLGSRVVSGSDDSATQWQEEQDVQLSELRI